MRHRLIFSTLAVSLVLFTGETSAQTRGPPRTMAGTVQTTTTATTDTSVAASAEVLLDLSRRLETLEGALSNQTGEAAARKLIWVNALQTELFADPPPSATRAAEIEREIISLEG
ncbi:hypothetical protein M9M90_05870 [Phenylobacterium sp. LH3H17]|uniref:hypothetical protein n=1 Tax=Phenylobacterium sp. LH3H17 TaxID=2903901 RepID=UPI0020C96F30|nr:hypothetical protein [Phenylobacterium sp. LH3H17]UTP40704.1 hypothetical protein M9M90_05870 [Phenylobacterium sp. LH3H17]